MIAETVSLGILSLPQTLARIGSVPGTILIFAFGVICYYTGYLVFWFKMQHDDVHTYADAMEVMLGRWGRRMGEVLQASVLVFLMAAHLVTFSVMMNTLTQHALCTVVFTALGMVISFLVTIPRTLKANSYLSIFCE
jgi:amino acid permease